MVLDQTSTAFLLTFLAGMSTVLGAFIYVHHYFCGRRFMGFFLGLSAGVMIYLSFAEMLPYSIEKIGFLNANLFFFAGIFLMAVLDYITPHHFFAKNFCKKKIVNHRLLSTGFMVSMGLMIHNIPEGITVFLSSYTYIKLGFLLAFAITVHNIPEGIAVAAPIYHATKSRFTAIKYAFISGMAEPLGALLAFWFFRNQLDNGFLSYLFSLVSGIMIYISFDELLPNGFREENGHQSIMGVVIGMVIVFLSLHFMG